MKTKTKKIEIVKFKTKMFGSLPEGTVINGYLLAKEGNKALLYFPKEKPGECGCLVFCKLDRRNGHYVDYGKEADCFINIDKYNTNFLKNLKNTCLPIG